MGSDSKPRCEMVEDGHVVPVSGSRPWPGICIPRRGLTVPATDTGHPAAYWNPCSRGCSPTPEWSQLAAGKEQSRAARRHHPRHKASRSPALWDPDRREAGMGGARATQPCHTPR